jgi:carbon storage regulator
MLVLSRRAGERIQIGDQVEVTVVRIGPGVVRIGVEAPQQIQVLREEVRKRGTADITRDGAASQRSSGK